MKRPLPYLNRHITRHNKTVWYVRVGHGPRVRMRADYGTQAFDDEYRAAIATKPLTARRPVASGTFEWAVTDYRKSTAWLGLSDATRRQRANILDRIIEKAGDIQLRSFTRSKIVEGRDDRSDRPAAARHFIETLRGLFLWAIEKQLIDGDPTAGVVKPKKTGPGHIPWTQADADAFRARWPLGTRERLAFELFDGTGLRISDVSVFGRQHIKEERDPVSGVVHRVGSLVTQKTGERVWFILGPQIEEAIAAGPCGDLTFMMTAHGKPFRKESLANWLRPAIRAAGVTKTPHGIRKMVTERDAEAGWSDRELDAKFGWRGGQMAAHYTRAANRKRLALSSGRRGMEPAPTPSEGHAHTLSKR